MHPKNSKNDDSIIFKVSFALFSVKTQDKYTWVRYDDLFFMQVYSSTCFKHKTLIYH